MHNFVGKVSEEKLTGTDHFKEKKQKKLLIRETTIGY